MANITTWTACAGGYCATFSAEGAFNLHIEHSNDSDAKTELYSSSVSDGQYAKQWESSDRVVDKDFLPLVGILKYYKVVVKKEPLNASYSTE